MSTQNLERATSRIQSHSSGGNNQARTQDSHRNATLFRHLDDSEKRALLEEAGYLHGFWVDGQDEPRQLMHPVARQRQNSRHPISFQERNNMLTEVVSSDKNRDANFASCGWSLAARSTTSPWIALRIAKNRNATDNPWITKRIVVQRLAISIALQDLEPVPEFEEEVIAALGRQGKFEKFQALDEVFQHWGDVIPLIFDLGTSLSICDLRVNYDQSLVSDIPITLNDLTAFRTARISTQGGDANLLPTGNAAAWLARTVQPQRWSQVRVTQVAPITELLNPNIKNQLAGLYSALLSSLPAHSELSDIYNYNFYDGSAKSLEQISRLIIHAGGSSVTRVSSVYTDGAVVGDASFGDVFRLNNGEHITMVVVWRSGEGIRGIQFITSNGRISAHYGGKSGTPTILSSEDGVLAGISTYIPRNGLSKIQTIWRHNVMKSRPNQLTELSQYVGARREEHYGTLFNDWYFFNCSFPESSHITSIKIYSSQGFICGIQVTYINRDAGEAINTPAHLRGGDGEQREEFRLESGEHIVTIQGAHSSESIRLLRFTTNTGRVSSTYGGHDVSDTQFICEPPQTRGGDPMRLGFIIGKSNSVLVGLSFAWVPLAASYSSLQRA